MGNGASGSRGVADAQVAIIKRYQPYSRRDDGRRLAQLNALAKSDKHRVVIPAVIYPVDLRHRDFKATNCRIIGIEPLLSEHNVLKLNARVVRVYVVTSAPAGLIAGVQMKSNLTLYPALARGVPVLNLFTDIEETIRRLLDELRASL